MVIPGFSDYRASRDIRQAYDAKGAVICRRVLSDAVIEQIRLLSVAVFSIFDMKVLEMLQNETRNDDPLVEYVRRYRTLQFIGEDVVRTLLASSHLAYSGFDRITSALTSTLTDIFFCKSLSFVPGKSALRRQGTQEKAYVEWHRDAHAVETAELGECLNCWVPLHAVGVSRPSLDVVLGSHLILRDRVVDYRKQDNPTDDQVNATYASSSICTAVLDPGDVLIFGHHTLHRTQPMRGEYPVRISGEFRFQMKSPELERI